MTSSAGVLLAERVSLVSLITPTCATTETKDEIYDLDLFNLIASQHYLVSISIDHLSNIYGYILFSTSCPAAKHRKVNCVRLCRGFLQFITGPSQTRYRIERLLFTRRKLSNFSESVRGRRRGVVISYSISTRSK